MEANIRKCKKIYRNCRCKNRNGTNELIEEEEISIFFGDWSAISKGHKEKIYSQGAKKRGKKRFK